MKSSTPLDVLYALFFAVPWTLIVYLLAGKPAFFNGLLFAGGMVLWFFTTYRKQIDASAIIAPYLLTTVAFLVHVFEEFRAHADGYPFILQPVLHTLFHVDDFNLTLVQLVTFAAFFAPILWLLGMVLMLKSRSLGYFLASTFLFGMMFIEPLHFIAPFLQHGSFHYVGGTWTAVLPISMGWYTFTRVRHELRKSFGGSDGTRTRGLLRDRQAF